MQFVVHDVNNQWYWQLVKNDGTVIAEAPVPITAQQDAASAISLIKQWAPSAPVVVVTHTT